MSVKKVLVKEGLILAGFLVTALSLFVFLEKIFPDKPQLHFKIALCVFIVLYAGRWAIRIFKGLLLIFFIAAFIALVVTAIFFFSQGRLEHHAARSGYKAVPEYSDPSKAVRTSVGREFIISLASNRSTGYGWEISGELDKTLLNVTEIRYEASAQKQLVGAPGRDTWTFKALRAGGTVLSFQYVRPWEKGVPPAQEASFSVEITP